MRIEQIKPQYYIKTADVLDRKFYEVIRDQIQQVDPGDRRTIEYIAQQVLLIVNERLVNQQGSVGVLSVNGLAGDVVITPETLGAEPKIDKKTAFNRDFGTKANTICQGNDPRLTDKREPTSHIHDIDELNIEELTNFINQHDKVRRNELARHEHDNIDVLSKLAYNGEKQVIDLGVIDDFALYLPQNAENISQHLVDDIIHVTTEDRAAWYARPTKAEMSKAIEDSASELRTSAEELVNGVVGDVQEESGRSFKTLKGIQDAFKTLEGATNSHIQSADDHLSPDDRTALSSVKSKADANHIHTNYLTFGNFNGLSDLTYS